MLAVEVEDGELSSVFGAVVAALKAVVVVEQVFVEDVHAVVAHVKLRLAQLGVVEEEAPAEVVDGILGARQKLVGEKRHVIARLAEHFGKERIVAPFALVAGGIEREEMLEDEAREVPRGHHVVEGHQLASSAAFQLAWRGGLVVAIELRVVLVVALADDEHDLRTGEGAAVYAHAVLGDEQTVNLLGREAVGIDAECHAIGWCIELGAVLACEFVLYGANVAIAEEARHGRLVGPACGGAPRQEQCHDERRQMGQTGFEGGEPGSMADSSCTYLTIYIVARGLQSALQAPEQPAAKTGRERMGHHEEQHAAHGAQQHVGSDVGREKLARLLAVGLAHQQQHGGIERRLELHEAIDVDDG